MRSNADYYGTTIMLNDNITFKQTSDPELIEFQKAMNWAGKIYREACSMAQKEHIKRLISVLVAKGRV